MRTPTVFLSVVIELVLGFGIVSPAAATGGGDDNDREKTIESAQRAPSPRRIACLDAARRSAEILRNTLGTGTVGPTAGLVSLDASVLALLDDIGRSRVDEAGRSELRSLDREIAAIEALIPPLARLVERERDRSLANVAAFEDRDVGGAVAVDDADDDDPPLEARLTLRGHRGEIADAFRREAIPIWDEAIAIAKLPYPAAAADWDRWNRETRALGLRAAPATTVEEFVAERAREMLGSAFPDLTDVLGRYTESVARLHGARVLLRLRAKTIEEGRWPSSLLEIEPGLPRDPFTGRPFRYRLSDDGVLLYSPGPDERDDGGDVIHDLVICTHGTPVDRAPSAGSWRPAVLLAALLLRSVDDVGAVNAAAGVAPGTVAMAADEALNVRACPGGEVIGQIRGGDTVDIVARAGDWYRIRGGPARAINTRSVDGSAYVHAAYIEVAGADGESPATFAEDAVEEDSAAVAVDTRFAAAVRFGRERMRSSRFSGYCLRFVARCYGARMSGYASARRCFEAIGRRDSISNVAGIPIGALVFFDPPG